MSHPKSIKVVPVIRLDNGKGAAFRPTSVKGTTLKIPTGGSLASLQAVESAPASHSKKRSPKTTAKLFGVSLVVLSFGAVFGLLYTNKASSVESTPLPTTEQAPAEPAPAIATVPDEATIAEVPPVVAVVEAPPAPPPVPFTKDTPLPVRIVLQDTVVVISQVMGGVGIGKGQTVEVIRRNGSYLVVRKDESVFAVEAASVTGYLAD